MGCSMKGLLRSIASVAAVITLLMGSAFSQSLILPTNKGTPRSAEDVEREKALEREYKRATEKIPEKKATDPWGNIRSSPPTAPKAKQPR